MTKSLQLTAPALQAPLAGIDEAVLLDAIGRFGADVLRQWGAGGKVKVWQSSTDRKDYTNPANGKRQVTPPDLLAHFRGEKVIALAPIARALVIDADLDADDDEEIKQEGGEYVSLILDSFAIPHVHHDGRSGYHTWIRLDRDATRAEIAALAAILNREDTKFQVFPLGGTALRMPFGLYCGKPRHTVPAQEPEACIRWLIDPERATDEMLAALVEKAPKPATRKVNKPTPDAAPPPQPAPTVLDIPAAPAPLVGWEWWPVCKRQLAIQGPLGGKRHNSLNALACEAGESGERDIDRLIRLLASVPRRHSHTSEIEHATDVRYAAEGALRLHEQRDPRRLSSCPHVPRHSGHPDTAQHRSAFAHLCDDEAKLACPIHAQWKRNQDVSGYDWLFDPPHSVWRDAGGNGSGLGYKAMLVYRFLLRRSGGDPEHDFQASRRYIAKHLMNQVRDDAVGKIRDRLIDVGLVERAHPDPAIPLFRVPARDRAWFDALAVTLGTDVHQRTEENRYLLHWQQQRGRPPRDCVPTGEPGHPAPRLVQPPRRQRLLQAHSTIHSALHLTIPTKIELCDNPALASASSTEKERRG